MPNYFSLEILAPNGLAGVEDGMRSCKLQLEPWPSGFNGKVILRSISSSNFEWSMDFHGDEYIVASGEFYDGLDKTVECLLSFSEVLKQVKFPHKILIDDEASNLAKEISYKWVERGLGEA